MFVEILQKHPFCNSLNWWNSKAEFKSKTLTSLQGKLKAKQTNSKKCFYCGSDAASCTFFFCTVLYFQNLLLKQPWQKNSCGKIYFCIDFPNKIMCSFISSYSISCVSLLKKIFLSCIYLLIVSEFSVWYIIIIRYFLHKFFKRNKSGQLRKRFLIDYSSFT